MNTTIELSKPIKSGDTKIKTIDVREPTSGELRGLKMLEIVQLDVDAFGILLPRICAPTLTSADIKQMHPRDLLQLMTAVANFLGDIDSPVA